MRPNESSIRNTTKPPPPVPPRPSKALVQEAIQKSKLVQNHVTQKPKVASRTFVGDTKIFHPTPKPRSQILIAKSIENLVSTDERAFNRRSLNASQTDLSLPMIKNNNQKFSISQCPDGSIESIYGRIKAIKKDKKDVGDVEEEDDSVDSSIFKKCNMFETDSDYFSSLGNTTESSSSSSGILILDESNANWSENKDECKNKSYFTVIADDQNNQNRINHHNTNHNHRKSKDGRYVEFDKMKRTFDHDDYVDKNQIKSNQVFQSKVLFDHNRSTNENFNDQLAVNGKASRIGSTNRRVNFNEHDDAKLTTNITIAEPKSETPNGSMNGSINSTIQQSNWFEVTDNGTQVRYTSCKIIVNDSSPPSSPPPPPPLKSDSCQSENLISRIQEQYKRSMQNPSIVASLHGLPPLPKSLSSGFTTTSGTNPFANSYSTPSSGDGVVEAKFKSDVNSASVQQLLSSSTSSLVSSTSQRSSCRSSNTNTVSLNGALGQKEAMTTGGAGSLDGKLAILRQEMFALRQLDLSLLSQLWSLNEAIQDFRQLLQDQDEGPALSPSLCSGASTPSLSEDGADDIDEYYPQKPTKRVTTTNSSAVRFRLPAPPPPPPLLRSNATAVAVNNNSSSNNSSE